MRRLISTIAVCTVAGAIGVFAQEQAPAQPQPPPQPAAAAQAPKSTLTGCVVQAKTTDGGTAYVLNKAEGGSAKLYVLGGTSQPEWSVNVNKKVEVTGPVQQPPAPADPDSKVLRPPLVRVESVKSVEGTCN